MKYLMLLCCLLAVAGIAVAGEPRVTATGSGEMATIVTGSRVAPEYPPAALEARFDGSVVLAAVIERDGTVGEIEVMDSSRKRLGFEAAAIDAVKRWRFEPARKNDIAVPSVAAYRLSFEVPQSGSLSGATVSGFHLASVMGGKTSPAASILEAGTDPTVRPDRTQMARLVKVGLERRINLDAGRGTPSRRTPPIQPSMPTF